MKKKLVISSGAGISAESGVKTFRDADGLWENFDVMEVASADGFRRNPELIHRFYNERRAQMAEVKPNAAHIALTELEKDYDVYIITQNVDNLHEQAGSSHVLHLHGELMSLRDVADPDFHVRLTDPNFKSTPETVIDGRRMRPDIVFFQEAVPNIEPAIELVQQADIFVVIGTSLVVYPAAGLIQCVRPGTPVYYIDPHPAAVPSYINVIAEPATVGMKKLVKILEDKG